VAALLFGFSACLLAFGCEAPVYEVHYEVNVTPAVVENDAPEEGPTTTQIAAEIAWRLTSSALEVRVTNRADTTAILLWEQATVAYDGGEPELLLCGSHAASPDLPQEPTAVPRRGQVALDAIPRSAAEWEWFPNRVMGGSWRATRDIMGTAADDAGTQDELLSAARQAVGRKLTVRIPVRIGSRLLTHIYEMRVADVATYRAYN
jgi:hypothetical protein